MDGMLRRGEVKTQTELARLAIVTPARITQIMKLLDLAPRMQERILSNLASPGTTERDALLLTFSIHWTKQERQWRKCLSGNNSNSGETSDRA
jgi:hypothetical protein